MAGSYGLRQGESAGGGKRDGHVRRQVLQGRLWPGYWTSGGAGHVVINKGSADYFCV